MYTILYGNSSMEIFAPDSLTFIVNYLNKQSKVKTNTVATNRFYE